MGGGHLAIDERGGREPVIRKLEPVSDLSPAFAALARHPGIIGPSARCSAKR